MCLTGTLLCPGRLPPVPGVEPKDVLGEECPQLQPSSAPLVLPSDLPPPSPLPFQMQFSEKEEEGRSLVPDDPSSGLISCKGLALLQWISGVRTTNNPKRLPASDDYLYPTTGSFLLSFLMEGASCVFSLLIYGHFVDRSTQEEEGGWEQGIVF